jgi:hypothetical protein
MGTCLFNQTWRITQAISSVELNAPANSDKMQYCKVVYKKNYGKRKLGAIIVNVGHDCSIPAPPSFNQACYARHSKWNTKTATITSDSSNLQNTGICNVCNFSKMLRSVTAPLRPYIKYPGSWNTTTFY